MDLGSELEGPLPGAHVPGLDAAGDALFQRVLDLARVRLGMEIAWLSRFEQDSQVFEHVAADGQHTVRPGASSTLEGSYCIRVADGRLPGAIPDARADQRTADLDVTHDLRLGAYAGATVRRGDGSVYGMLCCTSSRPQPTLGENDVAFLEILAQLVGEELDRRTEMESAREHVRERVRAAIDGGLTMLFQPMMDLRTGRLSGCEALARFDDGTRPDLRFAEAAAVGLHLELEMKAIEAALESLPRMPDEVYLSVNASPDLILSRRLEPLLASVDPTRIVLEVTEHAPVADYGALLEAVGELRRRGLRLAVDDAGAGFASLGHILSLRPDIVKLDMSLTRDVHRDPVRRALAGALVRFCGDTGATLVAEGVENQDELDALYSLGATYAQGFFVARPGPLPLPADLPQPTSHRLDTVSAERAADTAEAAGTDLQSICRPLLERLLDITGFDVSYVTVRRPDTDMLEQRYVSGRADLLPAARVVPWEKSLCAWCRARGILWTADAAGDLPRATNVGNARSFLSVPFQDSAGVDIGSVCAIAVGPRHLSGDVLEEVRAISARVGEWMSRLTKVHVPLLLER